MAAGVEGVEEFPQFGDFFTGGLAAGQGLQHQLLDGPAEGTIEQVQNDPRVIDVYLGH